MKTKLILLALYFPLGLCLAQTQISGRVADSADRPIAGANVYLQGSYEGASTDGEGRFEFGTHRSGTQTLVVSILSFQTHYQSGEVSAMKGLEIKLQETVSALSGVTLTAAAFLAGDNSKASALKPLDIVTTAGAAGDFVAALGTLPGTATINEDGRLFVRGGMARETQVFIDGLRVFQPFTASADNLPVRGRFSPFLFKGINFSTGGYSAEYGQALSSVLLLNTTDVPLEERTDIGIMSVGASLGHTEIWGDRSLALNTSYINLAPYQALLPANLGVHWDRPYESLSGEAVFRSKGERGLLKFYTGFNHSDLALGREDINSQGFVPLEMANDNLYFNSSYKHFFGNHWSLVPGASIAWDRQATSFDGNRMDTWERASHLKLVAGKKFSNRWDLRLGTEYFLSHFRQSIAQRIGTTLESGHRERLWASFVETTVFLGKGFGLKLGLRGEGGPLLGPYRLSPRLALAQKTGKNGQFALAYGDFHQSPGPEILQFDRDLGMEKASHYILNYQYSGQGRTFRVETFFKQYDHLVKYDGPMPGPFSVFNNSGEGYAQGLDLFFRDDRSIDNLHYWVSYSLLDTQRDFRDYPQRATPNFAPRHSLSVVTKYWIGSIRSQVGLTYSHGSGRPYDDPNRESFMQERTRSHNALDLGWAYLIDQQKILYFSVNNVLGFKNIGNYQYEDQPGDNGRFDRRAIGPDADRFFFVGFFWTLSSDGKGNQLDNL